MITKFKSLYLVSLLSVAGINVATINVAMIIVVTVITALPAYADSNYADASPNFATCPNNFYQQVAPTYQNTKLIDNTHPLCFQGFAVLYSGYARTPLWSAEHLTRQRIEQADKLERKDSFHEERQLPYSVQAKLKSYSGSGYDRGHLAPNSDMANQNQQYDSFSLANIAPQSPYLNRHIWKKVESATRYLTKVHGESYVLTGTVFRNTQKLDNAVSVPSHLYKVVYLPTTTIGEQAGVYYAPNDESGRVDVISLEELTRRTGINAMPALSEQIKATASDLPLPNESFADSTVSTGNLNSTNANKSVSQTQSTSTNDGSIKQSINQWIRFLEKWFVGVIKWIKEQIQ